MKNAYFCAIFGCVILLILAFLNIINNAYFGVSKVYPILEPIILIVFIANFYKRLRKSNIIDDAFGFNDKSSGEVTEGKYKNADKDLGDNVAEKVIALVANIFLILGIIGSIGMCLVIEVQSRGSAVVGVGIFFGGILVSFIIWASLMVIANISNNIRQIKYELRKNNKQA